MKGLPSLTYVQRAKMLFELFPTEIIDFITFQTDVAQKIIVDKEKLKNSLTDAKIFPAEGWIGLAENIISKIKEHETKIKSSSTTFGQILFDGDDAYFSKHCLLQFILGSKVKNTKFKIAVELFFQ